MKHSLFAIPVLLMLVACANSPIVVTVPVDVTPPDGNTPFSPPDANSYVPQPGDEASRRGNAYLDSTQVLIMESYPIQVMLNLQGNLPDPCHQLRVAVSEPDEQNRIAVDVYSIVDDEKVCIQVLAPFDANINLGSFSSGHYTIWVNGDQVGEFDA